MNGLRRMILAGCLCMAMRGWADLLDFSNPGASLSLVDYSFIGEVTFDFSGGSVSSAGDVDGDGLADFLIGAYGNDDAGSEAGKSYLLFGSTVSSMIPGGTLDLSLTDYTFVGELAADDSGISASSAGDVDGDGLDDILIGAYRNDDGGNCAGKTYIMLASAILASPSTDIDLTRADYMLIGEDLFDYSGESIASAGDVDGDGLDDILIGAGGNDDGGSNAGKTYLMRGYTVLASGGSIDLSTADYLFVGEAADDLSGYPVASAGDVDGDGLDDILIGARGNDDGGSYAGKTYLVLASTMLASTSRTIDLSIADYAFIGEAADDNSGHAISSAGDVDGDGLADVLIGAYGNDDGGINAGKTYLIFGSSVAGMTKGTHLDLSAADYSFVGEAAYDDLGWSVASAGDIDGDGFSDLLMGSYGNDEGGSYAGKTYVMRASTILDSTSTAIDLSLADYALVGEAAYDYSSVSLFSAGDVNGDGFDDILIGAHGNDDGGSYAGKTYLVLGQCVPDDTVYVDSLWGDDANGGCESYPVATITRGLDLAQTHHLTNVLVMGGTYTEVVHLFSNVCVKGELRTIGASTYPPLLTDTADEPYLVYGADNATLKYFALLGGGVYMDNEYEGMILEENMVSCSSNDQEAIWVGYNNNVIKNNLLLSQSTNNTYPLVRLTGDAHANTFINNTMHRYSSVTNDALMVVKLERSFKNTFMNNILYASAPMPKKTATYVNWYGFYNDKTGLPPNTIDFNWTSKTNYNIALSGKNITTWNNPAFSDPLPTGIGYTLLSGLCVDGGNPSSAYDDEDGTRNDMGCYGGPNGLDFAK